MARPARSAVMSPDRLAAIGRAIYGEHWTAELARALDVTKRTVERMRLPADHRDHVPFHEGYAGELVSIARGRAAAIVAAADELEAILNPPSNRQRAGASRATLPGPAETD